MAWLSCLFVTLLSGSTSPRMFPSNPTRPVKARMESDGDLGGMITLAKSNGMFASKLGAAIGLLRTTYGASRMEKLDSMTMIQLKVWKQMATDIGALIETTTMELPDMVIRILMLENGEHLSLITQSDASYDFDQLIATLAEMTKPNREIRKALLMTLLRAINEELKECELIALSLTSSPRFVAHRYALETVDSFSDGFSKLLRLIGSTTELYNVPSAAIGDIVMHYPYLVDQLGAMEMSDLVRAFVPADERIRATLNARISARSKLIVGPHLSVPDVITKQRVGEVLAAASLPSLGKVGQLTLNDKQIARIVSKVRKFNDLNKIADLYATLFSYLEGISQRWTSGLQLELKAACTDEISCTSDFSDTGDDDPDYEATSTTVLPIEFKAGHP